MREYPSAKVDEAYEKTATASGLAYVRRALEHSFKFFELLKRAQRARAHVDDRRRRAGVGDDSPPAALQAFAGCATTAGRYTYAFRFTL